MSASEPPAHGLQALRAADRAARELARREFTAPVVLEAGAGTGKTETLVGRVLAWSLQGGWERARAHDPSAGSARAAERVLERIAMITFTEKAAVEMGARVARGYERLLSGEGTPGLPREEIALEDGELRERAEALAAALDRLAVGTIHSFCSSILAAHAVEAGLHPGFQVDADGALARRACSEVVSERLASVYGERPDPDWLDLVEQGVGPAQVLEALSFAISRGVGEADLRRDPCAPERFAELAGRLRADTLEAAGILGAACARPHHHLKITAELGAALSALADELDRAADLGAVCEAAERAADSARWERLGDYARGKLNGAEKERVGDAAARLSELSARIAEACEAFAGAQPELARAARAVLAPLVAEVSARLRRRGVLTFEELLSRTRDLLRDDARVRELVRGSFDQLLVDEFQDTDEVQCEIVGALALDPGPPRPGLFLVGDPKQSIYGWRSADLKAYEEFVRRVGAAGGRRAPLHVNFRSSQAVLDEVTALVEPVMAPEPALQPPFEPLIEGRRPRAAQAPDPGPRIEHWRPLDPALPPDRKLGAERAREIEAAAIADDLARLRDAGAPLGRCAILLRVSTVQEIYLRALRERGIAYTVGKDRHYYRKREVIEAAQVVAAILDPGDGLALCAALRSAWVGVPDAALAPLWRLGFPSVAARLGADVHALEQAERILAQSAAEAERAFAGDEAGLSRIAGWPALANAFVRALAELRRGLAADGADRVVQGLRERLSIDATEAARWLGAHRLANLERFFRELTEGLCDARRGVHELLRELREGVEGGREAESSLPGDEDDGAVRVLTVHAAKGLEFAHVYLADLHHESPKERTPALDVERVDGERELVLFGARSLSWHRALRRRREVRARELVRLLYVAATRAEDRLVLCGLPGKAGARGTFADLLAERAGPGPDWDALAQSARRGERAEADDGRLRARIVVPAESDGPARAVREAAVDREVVLAAATRDRENRERARERMALRCFAGASSEPAHEAALEREDEPGIDAPPRELARAIGTAVHRALQRLDLLCEPGAALERTLGRLESDLSALVAPSEIAVAAREARAILEGLAGSEIAARFAAIRTHVLARELPLALASSGGDGPLRGWVGAADLVYRSPEDGCIVVADYKTDDVGADGLEERARRYASQGRVYVDAVSRALGAPARFELWFLRGGRIVPVATSPSPSS